jgi:bifunctional oligoribonuclease and PAP phosphatase NrnA
LAYLNFFDVNEIKINEKMATSLYAGLLLKYKNFSSSATNGIVFASANRLIELKANYKIATQEIVRSMALSLFRLKAILYKTMQLLEDAKLAYLFVSDQDLKASGAQIEDAYTIMEELMTLVHIESVVLLKSDENNKIIKTVKDF